MAAKKVRVRFAPSPTGPLHMGGVRTALYNYLFAKNQGGDFLLRIEDTDQTRFVEGAEAYIIESLKWCGIEPDEGVGFGGDHGPYRQSERGDIYKQWIQVLLDSGNAYYAFDTPEEIAGKREAAEQEKAVWQYDASTRHEMRNSESLPDSEVQELLQSGAPATVRFKMPESEDVVFDDAIRGTVTINTKVLDDKVLMKSDGLPTYHFANVVDDHLMEISHVIRGEEWLPSAPLHNLLYRAFDWTPPTFAHLPLILKPTGSGKLSKRDGDKGGFPVFPLDWKDPKTDSTSPGYRESGYFPEAFINMLLMLGWNPGTEQEIFSLEEMVAQFSLERVVKSGARFNPDKAKWFNEHYLRAHSPEDLGQLLLPILKEKGREVSSEQAVQIAEMFAERSSFVKDLAQADYLFEAPQEYNAKALKKKWKEGTSANMKKLSEMLSGIEKWDAESIEVEFKSFLEREELGLGAILPNFRNVLTGEGGGPSMFAIAAFIGKEETVNRIETGLTRIDK